jgi:hypothetical protein
MADLLHRQIRSLGTAGKASVVVERQRRSGKPIVKVGAGSRRENVDRVADRADQADKLRAPDFDLVLSRSRRLPMRDRQRVVYAAALLVVMPRSAKRVCMPMRRVS